MSLTRLDSQSTWHVADPKKAFTMRKKPAAYNCSGGSGGWWWETGDSLCMRKRKTHTIGEWITHWKLAGLTSTIPPYTTQSKPVVNQPRHEMCSAQPPPSGEIFYEKPSAEKNQLMIPDLAVGCAMLRPAGQLSASPQACTNPDSVNDARACYYHHRHYDSHYTVT